MPLSRLLLLLAYVIAAAAVTVFLAAQMMPAERSGPLLAMALPAAMISGLLIRYLRRRIDASK